MSKDIAVQVKRAGAVVLSNVYLQLDTVSMREEAYYTGASPYERFEAYALYPYDIRQTDLLVDMLNIDPKTSTNYHYRVADIPEYFPDGHVEMTVDLVRGT